jgi:hypothetical protein
MIRTLTTRLTVTLAGTVVLALAAPAAHASTATVDTLPDEVIECTTAECQGPWWDGSGFPDDDDMDDVPPQVGSFTATGKATDPFTALERAMDKALQECPSGIKVTDTDTVYNSTTNRYTVTVDYRCTL